MWRKVSLDVNNNQGHFESLIQNWLLGIPVVPETLHCHVPFTCETKLKLLDDNNKAFSSSNCLSPFSLQKWKTTVYPHHFQNQSLGTKTLSRNNLSNGYSSQLFELGCFPIHLRLWVSLNIVTGWNTGQCGSYLDRNIKTGGF